MHTVSQISEREEEAVEVRQVAIASAILLYTVLWLVAYATGTFNHLQGELRPYLPGWFLVVNALLIPVTNAISGLRSFSRKVSLIFFLILSVQLALLGLTAEKYPIVKGSVTIFLYYETFLLIPNRNRRILEKGREGQVLNLDQRAIRYCGPHRKTEI